MGYYRMTAHPSCPYLSLAKVFKTNLERRGRVSQCCAIHINFGPMSSEGVKDTKIKTCLPFRDHVSWGWPTYISLNNSGQTLSSNRSLKTMIRKKEGGIKF